MPKPPELVWLDNLTPKSTRFDDTYYSRQNGLQETRYVFIEGNELPSRWQAGECPVIGELGFGTGLNFVASWKAWLTEQGQLKSLGEDKGANGRNATRLDEISDEDKCAAVPCLPGLTFVSFEKYPVQKTSLLTALSPWPELSDLVIQLSEQWQPDRLGWQTLDFGTALLHLFIGDAARGISTMPVTIDAWFLDGFNPKTNPDLWSLELMRALRQASSPSATLASYTAAGWVRRNLQAAGFAIAKRKGFGHKRDMITGTVASTSI